MVSWKKEAAKVTTNESAKLHFLLRKDCQGIPRYQARRTVRWNVEQYTAHAKQQAPTTKLLSRLGSRLGDCARRRRKREQIETTDGESVA